MKTATIALLMGIGLAAPGCSKEEEQVESAFDKIGVAECDEYFKVAESCIRKNATMKGALEPNMKQNHETWKGYAKTAQGREALKTSCRAAHESLTASCK